MNCNDFAQTYKKVMVKHMGANMKLHSDWWTTYSLQSMTLAWLYKCIRRCKSKHIVLKILYLLHTSSLSVFFGTFQSGLPYGFVSSYWGGYFLWQPQAVEAAKISTTLSIHRGKMLEVFQVVPQVTAAEAAGQVLSNSVGRVMVERVRIYVGGGVEKDHKLWGEFDWLCRCCWKYGDQLIQEHADFFGGQGS